MLIIHHRVNSIENLSKIPKQHGIEVDVRYHHNDLILSHDPFEHHNKENTKLKDLACKWESKGPIILNLKSEGIEEECIKIMKKYKINNWFFLDMSIPFLIKYSERAFDFSSSDFSPDNLAIRFSDKEPIEQALSLKGRAKWIWVDYFKNFPLTKEGYFLLKNASFKICLVSPEIKEKTFLSNKQIAQICCDFDFDAICTKKADYWEKFKS